nr:uncharacterized protein LOC110083171 isoform X1 [Pogona vitticeps]XP_020657078.1 uncharacterized protein LOC110083171 isoform X1 [Pogona vitticeps]XP_020657087.1 uncharacterized protein LOC110083171 isoform X1 [Pogona vitticeps]
MLVRPPYWTCSCWLGVCFWLLTGEGGCVSAQLCRSPLCSRNSNNEHPPSKQQCQGPHCSGRVGHTSRAFLHPASPVQGQTQSKQPPPPLFSLQQEQRQRQQQPFVGGRLEHSSLSTRHTAESCFGGGGGGDCAIRAPNGTLRNCKGIECRLPPRLRQKPRLAIQAVPCPPNQEGSCPEPSLVRETERAAQFVGEDLAYTASELGSATLGVQLTCDVKPGENEVPSEDALVLQLQLMKGQEKFVEALKSQQTLIMDLQQKLAEQQNTLVTQQREIIEQQRKMYEQMDLIKVQYGMLFDTVKQMSLKGLQEDLQHYFEGNLQGLRNQLRSHLHKSYSGHKIEFDAKVIGEPLMGCGLCESGEFCNFQKTPSRCERCTLCPAGFFQLSECSANADRICQDRDECVESPSICGERIKCLNTPGGFRCLGVAEKEAALGLCGEEYFFNKEVLECQACLTCEDGVVAFPCTLVSDTICSTASENKLSESWAAHLVFPLATSSASQVYPGFDLTIKGEEKCNIVTVEGNRVLFKQHGLMWADFNFAVKHNCRNFLHLSLKFNNSEEDYELSGVRVEQPEGKILQSVTLSSATEVEPGHVLSVFLKSPNQFCNQSKDLNVYDLHAPLSLFWLSHDTGAVAMTAQTSTAVHYQTNYRPAFKLVSLSDPYMLALSHDGRAIRFTETGVVKFVFHQALYSMGHTCIREGFSLASYLNRNGTNTELMTVHKSGVNYRDTTISASGATRVEAGDLLSFEILSPAQCSVRYFGDSSGISMLSLIWIPSAVSTELSALVSIRGLPTGAVRNRLLDFTQVSPSEEQIHLISAGQYAHKYFVFNERGVASVAFTLKLIHSCNMLQVTLNQLISDRGQPKAVAQQVGGQMPEGAIWTSVSLRSSFKVHNGTMISISLNCVRGRVNHIAHERGTSLSILWISS